MALPATEDFTGADGTQLTTYNANWTLNVGDFDIQTNQLASDSAGSESAAHWNADVFDADQYAEVVLSDVGNGGAIGVCVRCATDGSENYYGAYVGGSEGTELFLFKNIGGSWSKIGTDVLDAATDGDVLRIEAEGTTIRSLLNGVEQQSATDSDLSSGAAGLSGWDDNALQRIDTWEGGNLNAPADTTAPTYDTVPTLDNVSGRNITCDATATDETDSTVNHYAVLVADAATAPSAEQIKAGNDSTGSAAIDSGSVAGVSNGVEASITLTGNADDTAFDTYWTVEDQSGNLASAQKVDATTDPQFGNGGRLAGGFGFNLVG